MEKQHQKCVFTQAGTSPVKRMMEIRPGMTANTDNQQPHTYESFYRWGDWCRSGSKEDRERAREGDRALCLPLPCRNLAIFASPPHPLSYQRKRKK